MKNLLCFLIIVLAMGSACFIFVARPDNVDTQASLSNSMNDGEYAQPEKPLFEAKVFPHGRIDVPSVLNARESFKEFQQANQENGSTSLWEQKGPNNVQGRITAIAVDPTNADIAYAGSAAGGVFKTTNAGEAWIPVFDDQTALSIGAVAIDPQNANTIYVGTGEANLSADSYPGDGLYCSRDGGASWNNIGLEFAGRIGRIAVDPKDSDIIHVAVCGYVWDESNERGVYRTEDGGVTWQRVLFINQTTGCIDIVQRHDQPETLFAAMWDRIRQPGVRRVGGLGCGVYRSDDRGLSWTKVNILPSDGRPALSKTALQDNVVGRIGLAIGKSNPEHLAAIYYSRDSGFHGLFTSNDGGSTWIQANDADLAGVGSSFSWYFGNVRIHPNQENTILIPGFYVARSDNFGQAFFSIGGEMHVDHHEIAFGSGPNPKIYVGNDGGVYVSNDNGFTFDKTTGDLPITQPYRVAIEAGNDQSLWLGTQDNGTQVDRDGDGNFIRELGGDGFQVITHPTDPSRVWAQTQWGNMYFSNNGGNNFSPISEPDGRRNWNTPHTIDPNDPEVRYAGSQYVFRNDGNTGWTQISTDLTFGNQGQDTTFGTLTTINVSPADSTVVWAGSDDGRVHVGVNENWVDVSNGLPQRWITQIRCHPKERETALVSVSGFQWGENISHVYRTTDLGSTWEPIGDGLPDIPVNDIWIDELQPERYFAATDVGVYQSVDAGKTWQPFGTGMPIVSVVDFAYRSATRELVAGTHGRSIFVITIPD